MPISLDNFLVKTLTNTDVDIDSSESFSQDASAYDPYPINDTNIAYTLSTGIPAAFPSTYTLTFQLQNDIESPGGCWVKFTFPPEVDISQVDLTSVKGSGLLVNDEGT